MCTIEGEIFRRICPFGATATGDDTTMWPTSITADADGKLYVSDEALSRISVLSSEGELLGEMGRGR